MRQAQDESSPPQKGKRFNEVALNFLPASGLTDPNGCYVVCNLTAVR